MGLDMYLSANRYFWGVEPRPEVDGIPIKMAVAEAAYWRKANQIHNWFVTNVQNGEDECHEHDVPREELVKLRNLCAELLKSKNPDLALEYLPPRAGFFFGSTEVDEAYWGDIEDTVQQIDEALEKFPAEHWDFSYRSSW